MPTNDASLTQSRPPQKGKKYFTLEEANRALPYVQRVVEDIASHYRTVVESRRRLEQPGVDDDPQEVKREYDAGMDHLSELIEELREVGVELKDFEKGLVDFPAIHEDREVYLCWHRGEETIQAWHEIDGGYAGRQDVSLLDAQSD